VQRAQFHSSKAKAVSQEEKPVDNSYLFKHDSTPRLIKKYFMYKFMGSNFFIN
jgi:hypothetical protein